jgi:ribonuclease H / adenosylcobalamin/alpha-ribazole phosphatase
MNRFSKKVLRLFLVRHGETADNLQMRYLGMRDEPLTNNGRKQARQIAAALSEIPIGIIITSPLRRAADTGAQIQQACGVELRTDARLAEGSFGKWESLTRGEVLNLGAQDSEQLLKWESDTSCAPPGGESFESVRNRVVSLAEQLKVEFVEGASVVLVSHVGPIKALLAHALNIPLQAASRFFLDPGTVSVVDWEDPPLLRLFNSHAHQGWTSARWMKS